MKNLLIVCTLAVIGTSAQAGALIKIETVNVVEGARALGLEMPISIRSDVNGVCQLLGYGSGIEGTKTAVTETREVSNRRNRWNVTGALGVHTIVISPKAESLVVDSSSRIERQVYSRQLLSVKCQNR